MVNDGFCNCISVEHNLCDDDDLKVRHIREHISFPTMCDGFIELLALIVDGENETDEANCPF
jgi:hypothetical protein